MVQDIIGKVPIVLDAVDCISTFEMRRRKIVRNPLLQLFSWTEWKKMAYWEAKAAQTFNAVVISSPIDKKQYPASAQGQKKLYVVPNAVDLRHFKFQQFESQQNLIISQMRMLLFILCAQFGLLCERDDRNCSWK
jgi:hypothetical protein